MNKKREFIVKPTFQREDERGIFTEILNEGPWETIIHGTMNAHSQMGNHYHRENKAFFYLVSGGATVDMNHIVDKEQATVTLAAGQGIYFMPFEVHTITYTKDSTFLLLKSYRYRPDEPDIFVEDK